MRNKLKYLIITAVVMIAVGCGSMESDAKKAASLINKSIELSHKHKFKESEDTYLKAQMIIDKYIERDKLVEFSRHLADYRDKEKKQNAK